MDNNKIKRIWNLVSVPFAFFLGAAYMWIGEKLDTPDMDNLQRAMKSFKKLSRSK